MNLKNILLTGLTAGGILLASYLPSKAQTVSGYISNLFNSQPIDSALVQIEGLGEDYTNEFGFYEISNTKVNYPIIYLPSKTLPNKLEIFNILGQRVLSKHVSLDDLVESRLRIDDLQNIASGIYPFRILTEDNELYGSGMIPVIEGDSPVRLVPVNILSLEDNNRSVSGFDSDVEIRINHPDYNERITYIPAPCENDVFNEGLINFTGDTLDHVNHVLVRSETWGSVRWPEDVDPMFTIWPYYIQNGQPVSQSEIDKIVQAIDSVAFYSEELFNGNITGQYIIVDSLPPAQTPGIIRVYYDGSLPFNSGVGVSYNSEHEVYYASVSFKFQGFPLGIFLAEVMKTVTVSTNDSDIIMPSIFNSSPTINYLTELDKQIAKADNSRDPDWRSPDTNYP